MARRKLSQQQKNRIQDSQQALVTNQDYHTGLVISHRGGIIAVETDAGQLVDCRVKSNLGAIVCGDRVTYEITDSGEHRVLAIGERKNLLQRVDGFGQLKTVAANLSQIFICLSVVPEPNLFLLDQYLVSAEQQNIRAIIVLNKVDLIDNAVDDFFELKATYEKAGYEILYVSAKTGVGIEILKSKLGSNTSVFTGVSGVGKSSLSNAILPGINIKTAEISDYNEEGRHTTRTSRLYHFPDNGYLIDTPGVRGFNPLLDTRLPLSAGFPEISEFSGSCRFNNCRHISEPNCAVLEALKQGRIARGRYQNYCRMLEETTEVK